MMKPIYKIFFLLSAALLWNTACNNDDPSGDKGEPAVISLSMNNIQTRGGDLYAGEELITQIRVYVFRGNYVDEMQVFSSGQEEFQNPFRIQTTTGPKTIYVVANEPAALTAALDGVTTLNALKGLITPAVSIPMEQPFTMTGYKPVDIAVVPGTPASVTIDLTRLVAKLTLKIKKGPHPESNGIPIVLKGVRLYRATAKAALWEGENVPGQTYWNHNDTEADGFAVTAGGTDVWGGSRKPVYVYENIGSVSDTLNRAAYIVIDALYNNVNARYRAYINDENSDADDHNYSLKRNHHYMLTATVNSIGEDYDGLLLQCKTIPWDLVESEQSFEDENPEINVIPEFTTVEGNVTSIENNLTFDFTLTAGPEGATWKASLDNGLEFGFGDITQTYGGIGETKTITIKPLKPYNPAVTRTTHFYITVTNPANGTAERIKLVNGQPDTQILITQDDH
ncbi:fimbrial protein [Bacteroides pyogenes]|uniref:fimbrial protein n=1 Tax=Bacteroides pyogenes TaxID=310300 RepID=UPI002FDAD2F5